MTSDLTQGKLATLAAVVRSPAVIVEVGVWLGACTVAMAKAAHVPIHAFDIFTANTDQVAKAKKESLKIAQSQNTLPIVRAYLKKQAPSAVVELHRGNAAVAKWSGPEIGLYVDDACKHQSAFDAVMRTFSPWFAEGAYVALLDFFFYEKHGNARSLLYQKLYVGTRLEHFSFIERVPGSSNAIFRWHR